MDGKAPSEEVLERVNLPPRRLMDRLTVEPGQYHDIVQGLAAIGRLLRPLHRCETV